MKKIITVFILMLTMFLSSCTKEDNNKVREKTLYDYMNSYLTVKIKTSSQNDFDDYMKEIENIYKHIHRISDYTRSYDDENIPNNLFTINQAMLTTSKTEVEFEIDEVLYDMLIKADSFKELTNGNFNAGMGYHIDLWKIFIDRLKNDNLTEVQKDQLLEETLIDAQTKEIFDTPYVLSTKNKKFYVTVYKNVLLDFGALAKGYATQKIVDYVKSKGLTTYSIDGGSSAISYALNWHEKREYFNIGLRDPFSRYEQYGLISKVKNLNIASSGSYEEYNYVEYKGQRYHHIISAKTKKPANYYYSITLVGENADELDAFSTAFFTMSEEEIIALISEKNLKIDHVLYKMNNEVVNHINNFEIEFKIID